LSRRERIGRWLAVVLWSALISLFSTRWFTGERTAAVLLPLLTFLFPHASPTELAAIHHAVRKTAHFAEYLVLSVLLYRALRGDGRWRLETAVVAVGLTAAYATLDEAHQLFVPGRTPALRDCLIDVAGAATGQGLLAARAR